jgi:hypothetical protein
MVDKKIFFLLFLSESQSTMNGDRNTHIHAWEIFLRILNNEIVAYLHGRMAT